MEEAVRISKILSELGLCSRREADTYIEQGLVTLDGNVVTELGTRAYRSQKIELKKQAAIQQSSKVTVILNKPVGYISHLDDDKAFRPAASLIIQDNFSRYACAGIACWFIAQITINIGSVTSLLPVIGVTLPLISYGGSSLLANLIALGYVLGVARRTPEISEGIKASRMRKVSQ